MRISDWSSDVCSSDLSRKFSRRFYEKLGKMPTALQAGQYSAVLNYLRAVEKSGSDNVKDVMNTLQNMPIHDAFARNAKLRKAGKLMHDLYLENGRAA